MESLRNNFVLLPFPLCSQREGERFFFFVASVGKSGSAPSGGVH